jgi:hypothetical protein
VPSTKLSLLALGLAENGLFEDVPVLGLFGLLGVAVYGLTVLLFPPPAA